MFLLRCVLVVGYVIVWPILRLHGATSAAGDSDRNKDSFK